MLPISFHFPSTLPQLPSQSRCLTGHANVSYFTQWKLYVADSVKLIFHTDGFTPFLCNLPLPYGSHLYFMLPPSQLEINIGWEGDRWDGEACNLTCVTVRACAYMKGCACLCSPGRRVSRLPAGLAGGGEGAGRVVHVAFSVCQGGVWCGGLSTLPPPWELHEPLAKQPERVAKRMSFLF